MIVFAMLFCMFQRSESMNIESFEPRRLFAVSAVLADGVLTVTGTGQADVIEFAYGRNAFMMIANGRSSTFPTREVKAIRIDARAGDDTVLLGRLPTRASINGGDGNDRLGGGAGDDTILGGRGNDTIAGNLGVDYLDGNAGDDLLVDDTSVSVVHGGGGFDTANLQGLPLTSGIEDLQIDDGTGSVSPGTIKTINGRLILTYLYGKDTQNERNDFSAPMPGPNGVLRIVRTQNNRLVSGLVYFDTVQLDITGADRAGLVIETLSYNGLPDTISSTSVIYIPQ